MADVLSQAEIDALLNAMDSGEEVAAEPEKTGPEAKNYDFRTAPRFSREQIRTFNIVYESFARLFTTFLSGTLRVLSSAEVMSVEETKYSEFVTAMGNSVVLGVMNMPPLAGPTLLEMTPDLAYLMIARLLGGTSTSGTVSISRNFTEIELVLLERMIRGFIGIQTEAWSKIVQLKGVMLDRIETSPQFAQIVAMNETIALITIRVNIGSNEGLMYFALPQLALEPINKQLNTRSMFQSSDTRNHPSKTEHIQQRLRNTYLPITAVFDNTASTVRDILELQNGDTLELDHNIGKTLTLKVGHLPKFKGVIGVKDNHYAIKITEIIHEEENENE